MKKSLFFVVILFTTTFLFSQEILKSQEEEYLDFYSLQGLTERPYLTYRTLSDNDWNTDKLEEEGHIWAEKALGTKFILWESDFSNINQNKISSFFINGIKPEIAVKTYGPEWFNSVNSSLPNGQNDGALWQGRGYNTSFSTGLRLEGYGLELTFKPQIAFSQNMAFDLLPAVYESPYSHYLRGSSIDYPQRFGDKEFWTFDWGDSEIRYSWYSVTMGFGTESIWLGPAYMNPILHSNNAPTYPKFDIGLRKTKIAFPIKKTNSDNDFNNSDYLNLGYIEGRIWVGKLSESDYFDTNPANNNNLISGITASYAPSFMPGFTLGLTKVCLAKWTEKAWKYINPFYKENDVFGPGEDMKMSVSFDYVLPQSEAEVYAEFGIDDHLQGGWLGKYFKYPWDTMCYLFGFKKNFSFKNENLKGQLIFETCSFEMPQNRTYDGWAYFFYGHGQILQGYTNKGQVLGSPLGIGGNGQLLQYNLYYPKGVGSLLAYRCNPNDTYAYTSIKNDNLFYRGELLLKIKNTFFITDFISVSCGIGDNMIWNPMYKYNTEVPTYTDNWIFDFSVKMSF